MDIFLEPRLLHVTFCAFSDEQNVPSVAAFLEEKMCICIDVHRRTSKHFLALKSLFVKPIPLKACEYYYE